jgi:ATP-binding cassette, subfamily B, bacterial
MLMAAISDCDIVVFDEATSALDRESVKKVIKMLKSEKFSDKTCIFVSHDTLVLNEMDKVYEIGSNACLIERPL